MSQDTLHLATGARERAEQGVLRLEPEAELRAVRAEALEIIDQCIGFTAEVEETEAECGAMNLLVIQQHLEYLRFKRAELRRRMQ